MGSAEESLARIAHVLRERRAKLGLTQSDLADDLGVTQAYVSALETAHFTTQTRRLVEALAVLGLELVALPRDHPVAREQRLRPVPPIRRGGAHETPEARRLRKVLAEVDLSRVENPRMADRLAQLQGLERELGVDFAANARVAKLLEPLRTLGAAEGVEELVGGEVGAVLDAVRRHLEVRSP